MPLTHTHSWPSNAQHPAPHWGTLGGMEQRATWWTQCVSLQFIWTFSFCHLLPRPPSIFYSSMSCWAALYKEHGPVSVGLDNGKHQRRSMVGGEKGGIAPSCPLCTSGPSLGGGFGHLPLQPSCGKSPFQSSPYLTRFWLGHFYSLPLQT